LKKIMAMACRTAALLSKPNNKYDDDTKKKKKYVLAGSYIYSAVVIGWDIVDGGCGSVPFAKFLVLVTWKWKWKWRTAQT
jgi:hypothetical protein